MYRLEQFILIDGKFTIVKSDYRPKMTGVMTVISIGILLNLLRLNLTTSKVSAPCGTGCVGAEIFWRRLHIFLVTTKNGGSVTTTSPVVTEKIWRRHRKKSQLAVAKKTAIFARRRHR